MFDKEEKKVKDKTNFSCNLFTETEFKPFQELADSVSMDKTQYFRQMLRKELRKPTIAKVLNK